MQRIDHPPIVQVKVKGVVRVGRIVWMAGNGLAHTDDLAHVFDDPHASGQVSRREHAFAVDARGQYFDITQE